MADQFFDFCTVKFNVQRLLESGLRDEAEELIIAKFRAGYSSKPLLWLVADLLALKGKAWPRSGPYQGLEIAARNDELKLERDEYRAKRRGGKRRRWGEKKPEKPEPRIDTLMREFKRKRNTIKKALAYFRIACREHDRANREFEAEKAGREAK
jgi:hypothetical protein